MADKEIIDGVNVSECEFLWKEKLPKKVCNNGNLDCDCNSNPNCYFKQHNDKYCNKENCSLLKAKEQECEAQRRTLNYYIKKITQLLDDIDKYELALDEIEELIFQFANTVFMVIGVMKKQAVMMVYYNG